MPKQLKEEIFQFVRQCIEADGPPTMRQIGERFGLKTSNSVLYYLRRLRADGQLFMDRYGRLSLTPDEPPPDPSGLMIKGTILPNGLLEVSYAGNFLQFDQFFGGAELRVARVQGDSFVDQHILDGDWLIYSGGRHVGVVRKLL